MCLRIRGAVKTALLILSLLSSLSATPKSPSDDISWDEIHAFIAAEAATYDSSTEAALWSESVQGVKTWQVGRTKPRGLLDGHGVGWPRNGSVITFTDSADAEELAIMVDDFRESQTAPDSDGVDGVAQKLPPKANPFLRGEVRLPKAANVR